MSRKVKKEIKYLLVVYVDHVLIIDSEEEIEVTQAVH